MFFACQLSDIPLDEVKRAEAIFINEGQFFGDLKETVLNWCENLGKHIYIVGLDGDRHRNKFGQLLDLIPFADYYEKLHAKCILCRDGTDAIFTFDQSTNTNLSQTQIVVGTDQYLPLCRKHYLTCSHTSQ